MKAHGDVEGWEDGQRDSALTTSGKATLSPDKNINIGQSCQTADEVKCFKKSCFPQFPQYLCMTATS